MADRFPTDTHTLSINLNSTRPPRGKDLSLKNSIRKAKSGLSAASSALLLAQSIPKKQSTVRPLTRTSAKQKGGKIHSGDGNDDNESPPSPSPAHTVRPPTHAVAKQKGGKIHSGDTDDDDESPPSPT